MPSHDDLFHSPKLNIQWAKDSFVDLKREIDLFDQSDPYAFVIEPDTDPANDIIKFKLVKSFPPILNKLTVDIAGYLRPIANHIADLDRKGRDGWKKSPPEIVAAIRALKPYKGGNNLLWALNKIANTHKHAIVCPFATIGRGFRVEGDGFDLPGPSTIFAPEWDRSKNEMKLFRVTKGAPLAGESNLKMIRDVTLTGVEFVDGQPVLRVFGELVRQVERIVFVLSVETIRIKNLRSQPVVI